AFFADLAALSSIQSDASGTALLNDPAELERIGVLVCRIIAEWDLLGEDGETPYPLTPEALVELPFDFLSAALSAAAERLAVGEGNGATHTSTLPSASSRKGSME